MAAAVSGPVDSEPLVERAPLQSPLAVQLAAAVEVHDSSEAAPSCTAAGAAVRSSVGTGGVAIPIVTLFDTEPPGPWQSSVKVVSASSGPTASVPLVGRAPFQPPLAVQLVAPTADQVIVGLVPSSTDGGSALRDRVGGAGWVTTVTDCAVVPPGPVHSSVKVVSAASGPVDSLPLVPRPPDQPPPAAHDVASTADQVRLAAWPCTTVNGAAVSVTLGAGLSTVTVTLREIDPPAPEQISV